MMHFVIDQNDNNYTNVNPIPLSIIDIYMRMYFQGTATIINHSKSTRSYYFQMQIKDCLVVFLLFQVHIHQTTMKLTFRPTQLLNINRPLTLTSLRSIIDLRNKFQFLNRNQIFWKFKWYFDQKGDITIEHGCPSNQFFELHSASHILKTIFIEVSDLLGHIIPQIISYLNLNNILSSSNHNHQDSETEEEIPNIQQKFKYVALLTKVYQNHRRDPQFLLQPRKSNQNIFPRTQTFTKTNQLVQDDTNYIQDMEKQRQQYELKFKPIFQFLSSKIGNQKDYLKMPKMRKVQNQFEEYVASIKKQHLQIDETTNNEYRILKGIQKYQVIKPPKILSKNGSHSIILLGRYKLHLSDTLFTYQHMEMNQYQAEPRHIEESLITKRISKQEHKASVNSFLNEINFLYHVKDKRSKFVATYFLPVGKQKQQIQEIFSRHYKFNLKEYLENKTHQSKTEIDLQEIITIAQNILLSLVFLVDNFVLHRDLKPQNIVIDENQKARLIDFGSCSPIIYCNQFEVDEDKCKLLTTPGYQVKYKDCPETITKKYTKDQYQRHYMYDIHSFGQTFKEIVSYLNLNSLKSNSNVNIPEIIEMIVSQCKDKDPMERITYDQLLFYMKLLREAIAKT